MRGGGPSSRASAVLVGVGRGSKCDGGVEEMDDDEKQMEGGRVSKLSGDYLPVTQAELSRCIVGSQHAG